MNDFRFAIRRLLRARAFTLAAVATLALGIGATTAVVTLANALLLRPLPYRDADRLVHIWEVRDSRSEASFPDFEDFRANSRTIREFAGYGRPRVTLRGSEGAEQVQAARVTDNFFDVLGVAPARGRTFVHGEDVTGGPRVVVLSDALWRRRFGADPRIVGRAVDVDGRMYEVVGVLPPSFQFAFARGAEVWMPLQPSEQMRGQRRMRWINVIARLNPGVDAKAADRELDAIAAQLAEKYPDSNRGASTEVVPLREELTGPVRPAVLVLACAAGFVLLIACVNVASLMIGRVAARQRDVAIRFALGASRMSVARDMVLEALVLCVAGALAGAFVGLTALRALATTVPRELLAMLPNLATLTLDARVLAIVTLVVAACAMLIGLWPALRASSSGLAERGVAGSVQKRTLRSALVVAEIALALILLAGAALTLRSMAALASVETGYQPEHVLTLRASFPTDRYTSDASLMAVQQRVLDAISNAAFVDKLPSIGGTTLSFRSMDSEEKHEANIRVVSADYFRVMGVSVLRGRAFDARDRVDAPPAVIINNELARRFLRAGDATMRVGDQVMSIAGVVADERVGPIDEPVTPVLYLPLTQSAEDSLTLVVRTRRNAATIVGTLQSIDRDIAVAGVAPMTTVMASSPNVFLRRATTLVIGAFAGISLLLALVGIYSVIAESVASRTREMAIRLSVGARPSGIVALVARDGLRLGVIGLALGLFGALLLTRSMQSILFGVGAHDPIAFATVAALLLVTVLAASCVPAIRAARIDPAVALRQE